MNEAGFIRDLIPTLARVSAKATNEAHGWQK